MSDRKFNQIILLLFSFFMIISYSSLLGAFNSFQRLNYKNTPDGNFENNRVLGESSNNEKFLSEYGVLSVFQKTSFYNYQISFITDEQIAFNKNRVDFYFPQGVLDKREYIANNISSQIQVSNWKSYVVKFFSNDIDGIKLLYSFDEGSSWNYFDGVNWKLKKNLTDFLDPQFEIRKLVNIFEIEEELFNNFTKGNPETLRLALIISPNSKTKVISIENFIVSFKTR